MTERHHFRISVSELAEFCCRRGDLTSGLQRSPTALEGQQGQRTVQQHRPAHYQREISVSAQWQTESYLCQLSGRIDGVQQDAISMLEEIKTTYCRQADLPANQRAVHWAQLQLYGALYLQQHDAPCIRLQLTYLNLDDESTYHFEEDVERTTLEAFYQNCRAQYECWLQWQCDHWQRRNQFLHALAFPFTDFRPGQRTLSVQAYRDLRDGQRGLYQAATGLGKTSGILFPALKLLGENCFRQIWYLTAKTSGQRSVLQALQLLNHASEQPLRVLHLAARERVCFCDTSQHDICNWQAGFYDRWHAVRCTLQITSTWTGEFLQQTAAGNTLCPHQLAQLLLPWADLVIADYNYAFDPAVRLADYFDRESKNIALLVDEAHNLPDRARDMFSARLQQASMKRAATTIHDARLQRRIKRLIRHWPAAHHCGQVFEQPPEKLVTDVATLSEQWLEWFSRQQWLVYPREQFEALMDCVRFSQRLQRWQPEDRFIVQTEQDTPALEIFCTDPAPQLDTLTQRFHAVLYFSGSLQPLDFFARAISQQPFTQRLELPSPFPPAHQLTLVIPVNTRFSAREASVPNIAGILAMTWACHPGRYLVSFPSYHYLQTLQQHLQQHHPQLPLLAQQSDSAALTTTTFVEHIVRQPCLALVIAGGSYAEGLDLPDNLLQGVIVVGTCMPPPSLQRELIQAQFTHSGYNGFDFAFRYPGLNRVIQSAGRVIRSETDRGIVMLVDDRFTRPDTRSLLPGHWQPRTVRRPEDLRAPLLAFRDADL